MAPIYEEVIMTWGGKTYTVTPTFAMIQKIEQRLSIAGLIARAHSQSPPYSQMAELLSICLDAAGCKGAEASAENINYEMWHGGDSEALFTAASQVMMAMVPRAPESKNSPAPEGATPSPKISTGQSTTKTPSGTAESNLPSSGE